MARYQEIDVPAHETALAFTPLLAGVFWGLVIGGVAGLLAAPKSGAALRRQLRLRVQSTQQIVRARAETIIPADPVAASLAEGRAAALRRREELGIDRLSTP